MKMLIVTLLLGTVGAVQAAEESRPLPVRTDGFYAGLGIGYDDVGVANDSISLSGGDLAYAAFGGYRFGLDSLPLGLDIAIELGYVDLGEFDDTAVGARFDVEADGLEVSALALLPVAPRWDLYGKVGFYAWDAEVSAAGVTQDDDSSTDLLLGLGAALQTDRAWSFRFELTSIDMLDGVWIASGAAIWQFK